MSDRRREIIRSSADWSAAWDELTAVTSESEPAPVIDSGAHVVVLAAMGSRRTGGYDVDVVSVAVDDATLYVTVRETSPAFDCLVTQALTSPAVAVLVPRTRGEAAFSEIAVALLCS
jgi:hypothetical protein